MTTINELSKGLIESDFCFIITSYSYFVRKISVDGSIEILGERKGEADSVFSFNIDEYEGRDNILVCIDNINFDLGRIPSRFSSDIYETKYYVHGEEGEDFRFFHISFPDMSNSPYTNYHMDIAVYNKEIDSINFVISEIVNGEVYETWLYLFGHTYE